MIFIDYDKRIVCGTARAGDIKRIGLIKASMMKDSKGCENC